MSTRSLVKIEMRKFIKRKDWISVLAVAVIGILFAGAAFSGTYTGPNNQSALYWLESQVFNTTALYISPFITAFMGTRLLSTELEEKTLTLYIERIQNKRKIYLSKVLAFTIYSVLVYFVMLIFQFILYQIAALKEVTYFSGNLLGANTVQLTISLVLLWATSFYLPGMFTLMLGTKIKPLAVMGMSMGLIFILRNTFQLPLVEWVNPWTYIIKLVIPFSYDTEVQSVAASYWQILGVFILLIITYTFLSIVFGIKLFSTQRKTV